MDMNVSKFNEFYNEVMKNNEVIRENLSDSFKAYLDELCEEINKPKETKPLTETGIAILNYMNKDKTRHYIAKEIANGIGMNSRSVSGAMRKLVTDGYVIKAGSNPIIYALDEKGKEFSN